MYAHLLSMSRTHCLYFIDEFCSGIVPGPCIGKILFCLDLVLTLFQNLSQTQGQSPDSLAPCPTPFPSGHSLPLPFPNLCTRDPIMLWPHSGSCNFSFFHQDPAQVFPHLQSLLKYRVHSSVGTLNTWFVLVCHHLVKKSGEKHNVWILTAPKFLHLSKP